MSIPPIAGSSYHIPYYDLPPLVQSLLTKETTWYNLAVKGTPFGQVKKATDDLLDFLNSNRKKLKELAKDVPCPLGPNFSESFSTLLNNAISGLEAWKKNDYPRKHATGINEYIYDVIQWAGLGK